MPEARPWQRLDTKLVAQKIDAVTPGFEMFASIDFMLQPIVGREPTQIPIESPQQLACTQKHTQAHLHAHI